MVVLEAVVGVFLILFGVVAVVLFIILCELLHVHAVVPHQCMHGHMSIYCTDYLAIGLLAYISKQKLLRLWLVSWTVTLPNFTNNKSYDRSCGYVHLTVY